MKPKFSVTLIHEHNAGQHRIVAMASDGTNSASEWQELRNLCHHLDVVANADPDNGLPIGIFRVREVPHQVLA